MGSKPLLGFIGQGFIGKNYADDAETRGFSVVRYALEEPYRTNKEKIRDCDIVFIAVPTPSTPHGFDAHILEETLPLVGAGKIAVIKSTILPGTTKRLQEANPKIILLFSPEFLSEATAVYDAAHPFSNIISMSVDDAAHRAAAELVLSVLPEAPYASICKAEEAEMIKYAHNISGYMQVITFNVLYDLARAVGADWSVVEKALDADPMISNRYAHPIHKSGRGAGGHCFIKDLAAMRGIYEKVLSDDATGLNFLRAAEAKNVELLKGTHKDLDLLEGVYGKETVQ